MTTDARAILDDAQSRQPISVGTLTVDVLPDMSEFKAIMEAAASGFVVTKTTDITRDENGFVAREVTTTTVTRG